MPATICGKGLIAAGCIALLISVSGENGTALRVRLEPGRRQRRTADHAILRRAGALLRARGVEELQELADLQNQGYQ